MDALATVLLRREGTVALPAGGPTPPADGPAWTTAFEADLALRGWLLSASLRQRFTRLDPGTRPLWADWILAVADEMVGADRDHVPLFRAFPDTPADPDRLFVERLLVHVFQATDAPCVLCGTSGSVAPLAPCGHLVCAACFDPAVYSACPICGRRLDDGAYLTIAAPFDAVEPGQPLRLRRITVDEDRLASAVRVRDDLVARPTALSEADVADLRTVVEATAPDRLDWLPAVVPARETLAVVVAWALHATVLTDAYARVVADAASRWATVTDVARCLWAYSGGDPGLILPREPRTDGPLEGFRPVDEPPVAVELPRVRALPRPLRRAVLSFVDSLDPATAAEDVARHPVIWKRLAERLHPYETVTAHPTAAVVFATLRGTRAHPDSALGRAIVDAGQRRPDRLIRRDHADGAVSVRVRSFAALVEAAVAAADLDEATRLLEQRPGDLWRRVDHLLRLAGDDPLAVRRVLDAAGRVADRVSPTVLAAAAAQSRGRDATVRASAEAPAVGAVGQAIADATAIAATAGESTVRAAGPGGGRAVVEAVSSQPVVDFGPRPGTPRRTFFPKGDVVRTWTEPERRRRLPTTAIAAVQATVDAELVGRAQALERFDIAVLDAALAQVPAPMRERAWSGQLAGWPRGSRRPLVDADVLRLFLHWTDGPDERVDLDLSCAFYDADWEPLGHCDYTQLRWHDNAAVHSGDLTSAPPPLGATEYLDLNRAALVAANVCWAVPVILSYNDVPFEKLDAAFAGFSLPVGPGAQFDAARVMQRFSLRGDARSSLPMILDVRTADVMWVDASLASQGYGHSVSRYGARLGRVAADLWEHFDAGNRTTVLDVVGWHAVARADRIVVTHIDGTATTVPVGDPAETMAAIRSAATAAGGTDSIDVSDTGRAFVATTDGDRLAAIAPAAADGSVALLIDGQITAPWVPASAADLSAGLMPTLDPTPLAVP